MKLYQGKLALIGITGIQSIVAQAIIIFTRNDVKIFDDKLKALDWLVEE